MPEKRPLTTRDVGELLRQKFPAGWRGNVPAILGLKETMYDHSSGNMVYFSDSPVPGRTDSLVLIITERGSTGTFILKDRDRNLDVSVTYSLHGKEVELWSRAVSEIASQTKTGRGRGDPISTTPAAP